MTKYKATAVDGPLVGSVNLSVERADNGDWPSAVVWTSGHESAQRHLYRFETVSVGATGEPVYRFERTLGPGEADPTV
jgi:hypothetical protein